MSNYYAPCFYRIDFVVILSYIELPWVKQLRSEIANYYHKSLNVKNRQLKTEQLLNQTL